MRTAWFNTMYTNNSKSSNLYSIPYNIMENTGTNKKSKFSKEKAGLSFICNKT